MNGERQDPQNRKDHMHTLNEWLGQEHATGYLAGEKDSQKRIKELEKGLSLILPLAKGYVAAHPVGANARYVELVEKLLV